MVDFDSLRTRIGDRADLVLFDEAVTCHNSGAYRAAFVFAWIAAAEGLLNKLDTMGAAQADIGAFVKEFKAEQDAGSGKDSTLLDQAAKAGFVDPTEYKALDGVRELRNQYGHPTATAPTATAAAAAIELAVLAVLAKPALLQHGGVRQLAERIGTDPHYIPNDASAITGWTVTRAPLIAEAARPLFIRALIERHAANLGQIDEAMSERCRLVAVTALAEWAPDLREERWAVDTMHQAHGSSAAAVFASADVWELLGEDDRYRILSRCLEIPTMATDPKLTIRLLTRAFELHAAGALNELEVKLVAERIQVIDGSWLVSAGAPVDLLLGKAAGLLNDGSFNENTRGTRILAAIPETVLATGGELALAEAGAALARAARRNAFAAINLVAEVSRQPIDWPRKFRVALALEGAIEPWLFNDEVLARHAMLLGLHDVRVAEALRAAISQPSEKPHVGFKADEVIRHVEERIDEGGDSISASAVSVVREVLAIVGARYGNVYGDGA
jgi:hypothetical protein